LFEEGNPVDTKTTKFYIDPEDLTPPAIHVLSPGNATCLTRPICLVFTIDERTTWIGYSLSGAENVTIVGNTTLTNLGKGSHRITVFAKDTSGNIGSSKEISFTVVNLPPLASFTDSGTTVPTGTIIEFDASSSNDPDGSISFFAWNFGDGDSDSGILVDHSYIDDGVYNVTLTVTDNEGTSSVKSVPETITNRPPVADFIDSGETVYTDEIVRFNASASYDPDGIIVGFFWDFGDCTLATGATVDHCFEHNGTYTVTLTVIDDDGISASKNTTKSVINRPDIQISNVASSKAVVGKGYGLEINVTIANKGDRPETFVAAVFAGVTSITAQTITLFARSSMCLAIELNSADLPIGNYTIWAYAEPVLGETHTVDNTFIDRWVSITIPGDVNGDFRVDGKDVAIAVKAYNTKLGNLLWNPNADINGDNKVDGKDMAAIARAMCH
jgi:PKD repeat protein